MDNFYIYTAGGMENLDWTSQTYYREKIKKSLQKKNDIYNVIVWNPTDYFNFEECTYDNLREVMEFDLNKVRKSDLIIVNFTHKPISLGTMAEIAIAYDRQIPIIGLSSEEQILHSWQKEMCLRVFNNLDNLINYVEQYYLN